MLNLLYPWVANSAYKVMSLTSLQPLKHQCALLTYISHLIWVNLKARAMSQNTEWTNVKYSKYFIFYKYYSTYLFHLSLHAVYFVTLSASQSMCRLFIRLLRIMDRKGCRISHPWLNLW